MELKQSIGEPITQEEFEAVFPKRNLLSAESQAVKGLSPLSGMKFPCRWKHYKKSICSGGVAVRDIGHVAGFKVRTSCKEGVLYFFRYE